MSAHQKGGHVRLTLRYLFKPDMGFGALHEVMEGRNELINNFYSQVWFGESLPPAAADVASPLVQAGACDLGARAECTHVIKREEITMFCRSTNNNSEVLG